MAPQDLAPECWKDVTRLAVRHGLAPMLLHAAKSAGIDVSGDAWQEVIAKARHTAMQYTLLDLARSQVGEHLAAQRIDHLWLKGIVLAGSVYPHPTLRPMGDLDVLIHGADRDAARAAVQTLGYALTPSKAVLEAAHHDQYVGGPAGSVTLEVHFRLLGNAAALLPLADLDWFWAHRDDHALTPEAHLLYLCAHAELQHDRSSLHLLRYLDLHLLITRSDLDWALIVNQAVALRWSYAVESALRLCIDTFDTPIPTFVLNDLQIKRRADEDITHVTRQRDSGGWERARGHLSVLTPRDQVRAVLRLIAPPREYMQARYSDSGWRGYVRRWWGWVMRMFGRGRNS